MVKSLRSIILLIKSNKLGGGGGWVWGEKHLITNQMCASVEISLTLDMCPIHFYYASIFLGYQLP